MIRYRYLWLIAGVPAFPGCARDPSINVLGAFFPAWMLCSVVGIVLMLVLRTLFLAAGLDAYVGARGIVYPASVVLFALSTWVVFFQN